MKYVGRGANGNHEVSQVRDGLAGIPSRRPIRLIESAYTMTDIQARDGSMAASASELVFDF